jgi:hypothetical protein
MKINPFMILFNADVPAGKNGGGGGDDEKISVSKAEYDRLETEAAKTIEITEASGKQSIKILELEQALTNLETERNDYKTRLDGLESSVRKTYIDQLTDDHQKIAKLIPTVEGLAQYIKLNTKSTPAGTDSGKPGSGYKDYSGTKWDDLTYDEKEEIRTKRPEVWKKLYKEKFGREP